MTAIEQRRRRFWWSPSQPGDWWTAQQVEDGYAPSDARQWDPDDPAWRAYVGGERDLSDEPARAGLLADRG